MLLQRVTENGPNLAREFLVDDRLERFERLSTGEETAVHEECGSARNAGLLTIGHVLLDIGLELAGGVASLELLDIQTELGCILVEIIISEGLLIGKHLVVKFPELALLVRAFRCLCGGSCAVMETKGEVPEDDANLIAIGFLNLL